MSTSVSVQGRELIAAWSGIDRCLRTFVRELEAFDASCTWAEDGHASCVSWLADKCEMSRSDAFEKLKVSRELTRRHALRAAFEAGLPYSKVRVLVRLRGVDEARDAEFVVHAQNDSIRVLDERVTTWNYYDGQDQKPSNLDDHYGIVRSRGFGDALGRIVIDAPDDMLDRLDALVDAYGEFLRRNENGEKSTLWTDAGKTPDADPFADTATEENPRPRRAQRLDWLFDLLEEAALADPKKLDRYVAAVGVTIQYEDLINATGNGLSSQGSTLTGEAVRRLACDADIQRMEHRLEPHYRHRHPRRTKRPNPPNNRQLPQSGVSDSGRPRRCNTPGVLSVL
ncbi:MAG TPA: hypothetical protein VHC63_06230 [Acidimicrobiales bacterium]|nr:hypothetical protein [Acidimicrobiales bacterium]